MHINTDPQKIEELLTRGVHQVAELASLRKKLESGKELRIKLGIDPTSPHLHIGRSVPLLKLRDFQELGHKIIFLVGDFTGIVGDTSDKNSERPMLTEESVKENLKTYIEQAGKLLDIDAAEIVYNSSWLSKLTFKEVAEMATAFSLHEFVARKNIKDRLDEGSRVSLRELLYPLMQGYDSVAIGADVELGGSDQWFNLLAGRTLQAWFHKPVQDVLTTNLIMGIDGRKMSSSWGNTINFTDSPEDMYGKVMRIPDEQIVPYFIHATRVGLDAVKGFVQSLEQGENPKSIKAALARAITEQFYGPAGSVQAESYFEKVITEKGTPDEIPTVSVEASNVVEVLVETGLAASKSEARRLIEQGGIEINGERVSSVDAIVPADAVIKKGKREFIKLE